MRERWMTLRADKCETPQGVIVEPYYVQEPGDWVHVVAFDNAERILILEQYRHGAGKVSIEVPCGMVEAGEPPRTAIERELLEETGCKAERIVPLPPMSPNPARYSSSVFPFVAFGTTVVAPQALDSAEDIEFRFRPIDEVMKLIWSGEMINSLHIASIPLAIELYRKEQGSKGR